MPREPVVDIAVSQDQGAVWDQGKQTEWFQSRTKENRPNGSSHGPRKPGPKGPVRDHKNVVSIVGEGRRLRPCPRVRYSINRRSSDTYVVSARACGPLWVPLDTQGEGSYRWTRRERGRTAGHAGRGVVPAQSRRLFKCSLKQLFRGHCLVV